MCHMYNHDDSKKFYSNVSNFKNENIRKYTKTSNDLVKMICQMSSGSSTSDASKPPRTKLKKRESLPEKKFHAKTESIQQSPLQCGTNDDINEVNGLMSHASISSDSSSIKDTKSDEDYLPKNNKQIDWSSYKRNERAGYNQKILENQFEDILKKLDESGNLDMTLLNNNLLQLEIIRNVYNHNYIKGRISKMRFFVW